jgi:ferrochelatase
LQPTNAKNGSNGQARTRGVLLINVGTPDAATVPAVRRYLREFLSDPMVIQLPPRWKWMQGSLARFIALVRGPRSARKYAEIWTDRGSPMRVIMDDQAAALQKTLPANWRVFTAMRYGQPAIADVLQQIADAGISELVVIPLYPQFSQTTSGTVVQEVYRVLKERALHINTTTHSSWHDDASYVNAQARQLADYITDHNLTPKSAFLLFSAHGLPVSYIERGDPYQRHITNTVRLVRQRLGWPESRCSLAYQSRLGPAEWLKPAAGTVLRELLETGEKQIAVCPISFTVDCLETLEEIGMEYRDFVASRGGTLHLSPALNADDRFINALKNLATRGPQPVLDWGEKHAPLLDFAAEAQPEQDQGLDQLVLLGVSLPSVIGPGQGPELVYTDEDTLACVKKPHDEVHGLLKAIHSEGLVREAFFWNTCHRFECYAWLPSSHGTERDCAVADLRQRLFGAAADSPAINTFFGADAWHHMMRTIAGLNSGLPGDKDVVEQFQTAFRLAESAGAAGVRSRTMVEEAVGVARAVRAETAWGRLDPGYCFAALERIHESLPLKLANCRHVIIGGSTTSRSIIQTLYEHYDVKEPSVTLVYRNHQGGQMKLLRKAVGHGRRLRVQSYNTSEVLAAIADADVLFYGVDRDEPILTAEMLAGLRDFNERPLTIIDFNTNGSTAGVRELPGVTLWDADQLATEVEAYGNTMATREEFPAVVREAEAWITEHRPQGVITSLELPCETDATASSPACQRCGRVMEPEAARRSAT